MKEMLTWAEEIDSRAKQNKAQQTQKKHYDAKHRPRRDSTMGLRVREHPPPLHPHFNATPILF